MLTGQYIEVEREGALTIITINRPEVHNALNYDAHVELQTIFDDYSADDAQRVAIITAAGSKAFCAGHDLKQQVNGRGLETPPMGFGGLTSRFNLNKPIIAAVNGLAMGGGFELALAADILVAASNAVFSLPEARVGIAPLGGGIPRLPREIGLKHAMGIMLTGRRVSAHEGYQLGFVNEVAEADVLAVARGWAEQIMACSPMSVQATKQAVSTGLHAPIEQVMTEQWHYPAVKALLASEDHIEGPRAFLEKRAPRWLAVR